jgi:AcrR family transcriptional regulator
MAVGHANPAAETSDPAAPRKKGRKALDAVKRKDEIVRQVAPIFLDRGYDSVSINEIVDLVGGSKTTIYSLFGGKEGLLEAVVEHITSEVTFGIDTGTDGTLEEQLLRIGRSFVKLVLSPPVLEFHRLMVSIGRTFPEAGQLFFRNGPVEAASIVAGWIGHHQKAGNLVAGDPHRMAQLYLDMLIGEQQLGWLTSNPGMGEPVRIDETVRLATMIFLGGCREPSAGS